MGILCLSLVCYALLCVHSSFAIIVQRERKLVALQLSSYRCIATINVLWLFLAVPWVGLLCVVSDHTHLLFVSVRCSSRYGCISTLCWNRRILILAVFTLVAIAQNKNDYKRFTVLKLIAIVVNKDTGHLGI